MQSLSMVSVSLADAISFHRNSKKGGKEEIAISKYICNKSKPSFSGAPAVSERPRGGVALPGLTKAKEVPRSLR